jgi:hypothetical protein
MVEKISWNYVAQALSGPSLSGQGELEIDAYDKFSFIIPDNATQQVDLVPGSTVSLLVINPDKTSDKLTYKVGSKDVKLDGPHVLIGAGAVSLLGVTDKLTFANKTGADATIEILIGRDATP